MPTPLIHCCCCCDPSITGLMWAFINILKNIDPFFRCKREKARPSEEKSWLLHACLLSFNSGKLKPFIWDFEGVFRLPCKLSACFKAHMQLVDLYCLGNCWESLLAVWRWMHTRVQIAPLIFFFHQNRVLFFFFSLQTDLSSYFSIPSFLLSSPPFLIPVSL